MEHQRTFKLDRLYHQFLKPKGIDASKLSELVDQLYQAGFIQLMPNDANSPEPRYSETEKLTGREHRDELFKLIQGLRL